MAEVPSNQCQKRTYVPRETQEDPGWLNAGQNAAVPRETQKDYGWLNTDAVVPRKTQDNSGRLNTGPNAAVAASKPLQNSSIDLQTGHYYYVVFAIGCVFVLFVIVTVLEVIPTLL
ncbi:unnamed protein product [Arabis nemorensis]|uniref:Uncharacterized protein n=1 Tax=Arabis nemorensis TaxID=586526 RepID=A0A565BZ33_9BRAS|nr:unnamed protein product [Arabis nemorensis]